MTQRLKATIAYDGTSFCGWQTQPSGNSIEQALEQVFVKTFSCPVKITGASRTDAGVHASGQAALIITELQLSPQKMLAAWDNALPSSIQLISLDPVTQTFIPHSRVESKIYSYTIFTAKPHPLEHIQGWHFKLASQVDWRKFEQCLQVFVGTHSFSQFCHIDDVKIKNTTRQITKITLEKLASRSKGYKICITGHSFLRFQIRRIIGSALEFSMNSTLALSSIQKSLSGHRVDSKLLPTFCAAASGLCLEKIIYTKS